MTQSSILIFAWIVLIAVSIFLLKPPSAGTNNGGGGGTWICQPNQFPSCIDTGK